MIAEQLVGRTDNDVAASNSGIALTDCHYFQMAEGQLQPADYFQNNLPAGDGKPDMTAVSQGIADGFHNKFGLAGAADSLQQHAGSLAHQLLYLTADLLLKRGQGKGQLIFGINLFE